MHNIKGPKLRSSRPHPVTNTPPSACLMPGNKLHIGIVQFGVRCAAFTRLTPKKLTFFPLLWHSTVALASVLTNCSNQFPLKTVKFSFSPPPGWAQRTYNVTLRQFLSMIGVRTCVRTGIEPGLELAQWQSMKVCLQQRHRCSVGLRWALVQLFIPWISMDTFSRCKGFSGGVSARQHPAEKQAVSD